MLPIANDAGMNRCVAVNAFGGRLANRQICTACDSVLQNKNPQTKQYSDSFHDDLLL
jgi:hypothetical protein